VGVLTTQFHWSKIYQSPLIGILIQIHSATMKAKYITLLIVVIASCNKQIARLSGLRTENGVVVKTKEGFFADSDCCMIIPSNWSFIYYLDADQVIEYPDSCWIYIQNDKTQNNENLIKANKFELYQEKKWFGNKYEISGVDSLGRHWKNISWDRINVGYHHVPDSLKEKYDEILNTFNCE
jgi:hypothetical protein